MPARVFFLIFLLQVDEAFFFLLQYFNTVPPFDQPENFT